jgi:hypothetical protein
MTFRFRSTIRICKGVRLNVSKRGITSLSIGRPGGTVNFNGKRTRVTVGIPGSGMSWSHEERHGTVKPMSAWKVIAIMAAIGWVLIKLFFAGLNATL